MVDQVTVLVLFAMMEWEITPGVGEIQTIDVRVPAEGDVHKLLRALPIVFVDNGRVGCTLRLVHHDRTSLHNRKLSASTRKSRLSIYGDGESAHLDRHPLCQVPDTGVCMPPE